jgi:hypothetical protein
MEGSAQTGKKQRMYIVKFWLCTDALRVVWHFTTVSKSMILLIR